MSFPNEPAGGEPGSETPHSYEAIIEFLDFVYGPPPAGRPDIKTVREVLDRTKEHIDPVVAAQGLAAAVDLVDEGKSFRISRAEVLRRRFGLVDGSPQTYRQIGESFGVSSERIRQLEAHGRALVWRPNVVEFFAGALVAAAFEADKSAD